MFKEPLSVLALKARVTEEILLVQEALERLNTLYQKLHKMNEEETFDYKFFSPVTVQTQLQLTVNL